MSPLGPSAGTFGYSGPDHCASPGPVATSFQAPWIRTPSPVCVCGLKLPAMKISVRGGAPPAPEIAGPVRTMIAGTLGRMQPRCRLVCRVIGWLCLQARMQPRCTLTLVDGVDARHAVVVVRRRDPSQLTKRRICHTQATHPSASFLFCKERTTGRCGDSHQSQMCTGAVMFFPRIAAGSSPPVTNALTRTPPSKNVYLPCQRTKLR